MLTLFTVSIAFNTHTALYYIQQVMYCCQLSRSFSKNISIFKYKPLAFVVKNQIHHDFKMSLIEVKTDISRYKILNDLGPLLRVITFIFPVYTSFSIQWNAAVKIAIWLVPSCSLCHQKHDLNTIPYHVSSVDAWSSEYSREPVKRLQWLMQREIRKREKLETMHNVAKTIN